LAVETLGVLTPPIVHGARLPLSNPPLLTTEAMDEGTIAFDGDDGGPRPLGFEAVTVKE
jgi:hypothetical protein